MNGLRLYRDVVPEKESKVSLKLIDHSLSDLLSDIRPGDIDKRIRDAELSIGWRVGESDVILTFPESATPARRMVETMGKNGCRPITLQELLVLLGNTDSSLLPTVVIALGSCVKGDGGEEFFVCASCDCMGWYLYLRLYSGNVYSGWCVPCVKMDP